MQEGRGVLKTRSYNLTSLGMLERAVKLDQCLSVMVKVALYMGSSKFGNALRASVGWNFVVAIQLS